MHRISCIKEKFDLDFYIRLYRVNQRWLWNFPEGPCSPCCSPSDCQSLTSTAAAIGWRANRVEHYWSAVLCHTDHSVQAPLFLLKSIFAAMQRFPPALDGLYCFSSACPSWLWQYKPVGIWKKAFWEIIFVVVMHNSMAQLFNLCRPVYRLHYLRKRPRRFAPTPHMLRIADISNYQHRIYNTGSLMHCGVISIQ